MYGTGGVQLQKQKATRIQVCGKCHWHWEGLCGCLFGEHDGDQRSAFEEGCDDWAPKEAKLGVLACGDIWMEVE